MFNKQRYETSQNHSICHTLIIVVVVVIIIIINASQSLGALCGSLRRLLAWWSVHGLRIRRLSSIGRRSVRLAIGIRIGIGIVHGLYRSGLSIHRLRIDRLDIHCLASRRRLRVGRLRSRRRLRVRCLASRRRLRVGRLRSRRRLRVRCLDSRRRLRVGRLSSRRRLRIGRLSIGRLRVGRLSIDRLSSSSSRLSVGRLGSSSSSSSSRGLSIGRLHRHRLRNGVVHRNRIIDRQSDRWLARLRRVHVGRIRRVHEHLTHKRTRSDIPNRRRNRVAV